MILDPPEQKQPAGISSQEPSPRRFVIETELLLARHRLRHKHAAAKGPGPAEGRDEPCAPRMLQQAIALIASITRDAAASGGSCSQIRRTVHPAFSSAPVTRPSLSRFRASFGIQ
jgi:hypothetical protein